MSLNEAQTPLINNSLVGALSKGGVFLIIGAHIPFQPPSIHPSALVGWMMNFFPPTPDTVMVVATSSLVSQPHLAAFLKAPRTLLTTINLGLDYQSTNSKNLVKQNCPR